jgi:predicted DNA-binding transcriptional regulator AlpA
MLHDLNVPVHVVRRKTLAQRLGISSATLWRYERDGRIPRSKRFGPNVVGWLSNDVDALFLSLAAEDQTNG